LVRSAESLHARAQCQTLQAALAKTLAGGQICALDSANYGYATINKISIVSARGATGALATSSITGITINAGANDTITCKDWIWMAQTPAPMESSSIARIVECPNQCDPRLFNRKQLLACSVSSPCQTLQTALALTAAEGEIYVPDSANYRAVTINKAVSITSERAVAGVLATSGAGITVAAGAGDVINLRGPISMVAIPAASESSLVRVND